MRVKARLTKLMSSLCMSTLGVSVLLVGTVAAAIHAAPAHANPANVDVFVGYADNLRANPTNFPTPWEGSPGVTYEGCSPSTSCALDAGAVRLVNNTAIPVTVDYILVKIDTCTYDLWPHGVTLGAGNQLIVTQTASGATSGCSADGLMDTSDVGPGGGGYAGNCTPDGIKPEVDVSIDGTPTAYSDSGQIINTGGIDLASCSSNGSSNESTQWTQIGSAPCPGAVLTLAPPAQTLPVSTSGTVTANLSNSCGTGLSGVNVDFKVTSGPNGGVTGSGTTDASGDATFTYSSSVLGTDTLQAAVVNPAGTIISNTVTIDWISIRTTLTYNGDTSGEYNDPATVSATLLDANNHGMSGQTVTFTLNGAETCNAVTTDSSSTASCSITPEEDPGVYNLVASYAGDASHSGSTTTTLFTVTQEESAITSTTSLQLFAQGGSATLSATLTDPDGAAPIAGKPVTLTLGSGAGSQSCAAWTGANGVATCTISPVTVALGPQPITDSFAGDVDYAAASNTQNALIFAYASGGSFVLGDQTVAGASSSTTVTFWGAQWSKLNSLSGGAAPSAFKGFATTPATPACGVNWTTGPGNSPPPPSSIPSYMAVIVTSSASQSGSSIGGNTVQIVIVKTDPGYAGDPGHAGTGTIVATLCH